MNKDHELDNVKQAEAVKQALASRIETTLLGLSEMIQAAIQTNDKNQSRSLIHTQTVLLEVLVRFDLEIGPHAEELIAGSGFDVAELDG